MSILSFFFFSLDQPSLANVCLPEKDGTKENRTKNITFPLSDHKVKLLDESSRSLGISPTGSTILYSLLFLTFFKIVICYKPFAMASERPPLCKQMDKILNTVLKFETPSKSTIHSGSIYL